MTDRSIKRVTPVQVVGLTSGVTQVTLGFDSGCALKTAGTVSCWGYNGNGQLGTGDRQSQRTPADTGLSGIAQISAGWDHTCAVTNGGGVKCWGQGKHGEIGDGAKSDRLVPTDVTGLGGTAVQVSAGFDHTCALLTGGTIKCWGNNTTGELGDGTTTDSTHPVTVTGLSATQISAGFNHTCAVTTSGAAMCWGANESGELGNGKTKASSSPVQVYRAGSGIAQISAGGYKKTGMTCLVTNAGAVQCFGANHGVHNLAPIDSTGGQLGDGTKIDRYIPITVQGLTGSGAASIRPDLLISKHKAAGYVGNGIYNTSGANQTKAVQMAAVVRSICSSACRTTRTRPTRSSSVAPGPAAASLSATPPVVTASRPGSRRGHTGSRCPPAGSGRSSSPFPRRTRRARERRAR